MRKLVRVLVAVTSVLTVFPGAQHAFAAGGGHGEGTAEQDVAFVQQLTFSMSLADFTASTQTRIRPDGSLGDTWFDWSTDLCSAPLVGNTGRSFNFTEPCRRHDFGYRNTRLLERRYGGGRYWNHDSRKRVDEQFLGDMKDHCHSRRLIDRPTCYSWAYTFYSAVRVAGGP